MTLLTRQQVLDAPMRTRDVEVPEFGGVIRLRELSSAAALSLQSGTFTDALGAARLVIASAVDESGAPLFTAEDAPALAGKHAKALNVLFKAVLELNGLTAAEQDTIAGNSDEIASARLRSA